jgi:hypothetical protein
MYGVRYEGEKCITALSHITKSCVGYPRDFGRRQLYSSRWVVSLIHITKKRIPFTYFRFPVRIYEVVQLHKVCAGNSNVRWTMSRNTINVLIYQSHKLLEPICEHIFHTVTSFSTSDHCRYRFSSDFVFQVVGDIKKPPLFPYPCAVFPLIHLIETWYTI